MTMRQLKSTGKLTPLRYAQNVRAKDVLPIPRPNGVSQEILLIAARFHRHVAFHLISVDRETLIQMEAPIKEASLYCREMIKRWFCLIEDEADQYAEQRNFYSLLTNEEREVFDILMGWEAETDSQAM